MLTTELSVLPALRAGWPSLRLGRPLKAAGGGTARTWNANPREAVYDATSNPGAAANFDPGGSYTWMIAQAAASAKGRMSFPAGRRKRNLSSGLAVRQTRKKGRRPEKGWVFGSVSGSQSSRRWNKSSGGEEQTRWKRSQPSMAFHDYVCFCKEALGVRPDGRP